MVQGGGLLQAEVMDLADCGARGGRANEAGANSRESAHNVFLVRDSRAESRILLFGAL